MIGLIQIVSSRRLAYHNVSNVSWRDEAPSIDKVVEDLIVKLSQGKLTLDGYIGLMGGLSEEMDVLRQQGKLSYLARKNYRLIYNLVVQQYMDYNMEE